LIVAAEEKTVLEICPGQHRTAALSAQAAGLVDAMLCIAPENIFYFGGFRTMLYTRFTALFVPVAQPDEPTLIAATIDRALVEERTWSPPWFDRIVYHGPEAQSDVLPSPLEALAPLLKGIRVLGVDSLRVSEERELRIAFPSLEIRPIGDTIDRLKQVKDEHEIKRLRQANGIALAGIERARQMLEAGPITELEIAVRLEAEARLAGADGFGYPTLVSAGAKMTAVHSPALPRAIEPHVPTRLAFGPSIHGYTVDVVRTLCLGRPSPELLRLRDGYLAAQEALFKMIRPGVRVPDMLAVVEAIYMEKRLRNLWNNNVGHGLGLTIHEPPRIATGSEEVLVEGMVLAIEPWLMVPGFGGYAQCDVIHVTAAGADLLSPGIEGIVFAFN
jgi:Xaa-Pro aminopeptidase